MLRTSWVSFAVMSQGMVIIFTEPWYPLTSTAEREIDREVEDPIGDMFNVGVPCGCRLRRQEGQGRLPPRERGLVPVRIRTWQGSEELERGHRCGWPQGSHWVWEGTPSPVQLILVNLLHLSKAR